MNKLYIQLYEEKMIEAMEKFTNLHGIQNAVRTNNDKLLTEQAKVITDFYVDLFQKLELLPKDMPVYKHCIEDDYDFFKELSKKDDPVFRLAFNFLPQNELVEIKTAIPIYFNFSDDINFHMVSGLAWVTAQKKIMLYLCGCILPKECTTISPDFLSDGLN